MKALIVLALSALAGCGTARSLEQLEAQAMQSGDWSLVEQREASVERRRINRGEACPTGFVHYCETRFMQRTCTCVSRDVLGAALHVRF